MDILRELEPALGIQLDSCICRRCRNDVRRLSEPGFIPRWRKESLPHKHCCVPECVNPAQKLTKLVNNEQLWRQFSMPDTHNPVGNDVSGYPLCTTHYGELYRKLHPVIKNCKTCNKVIDHAKHRKCPDPTLIERFLQHNTSFSGTIDANDPICYACYKAHLVIVKLTSSTTDSSDHDLHTLIQQLKGELKNEGEISTQEEAVSHAVRMSAVLVGETLLVQNAILLPEVFDYFESIYSMTAQDVVQQCSLHSIANPTWLLSQLSALLEQHMSYRCSVKKYGTVLYRYGGDLLHALNVSLGQSRTKSSVELKSDPSEQHDQFQKHLHEVCVTLNAKCHVATKKLVNENLGFQHLIEKVDIGKCIDDLDPDLWKAICLITQPLSSKALTSVNGSHIRQMRRFFCACCLLYATNNQCSFPLHTLITDVVLTCGGSSRLVKFLNRLGICTSADKHDRYVTERVKKRKEDGVLSAYPDGAFTVASTDNLDFLHHYARVYCGKQQTSWHGTTVQLVQPQPSNIIDSQSHSNADCSAPDTPEREVTTLVEGMRGCDTHVSHNRHPASGLQASISKRLFSIISPAKSPTRNAPPRKQQCTEQTQEKSLGIADFQLSEIETKAIDKLERMATDYAMLKVASCEHNISLIDLQTYYSLSNGIPSPECSNVIYFMVLDQRCDDKETLLNVISELHTEFIASKKKMYLLLEGDQVTYERLQSIKKEYGNDLKWLLPFPGDWHLLKNYQEVLLKIYFDAGLSDLAKISGYLPNSVGSNFKRIHHFLLEVWESLYRYFLATFIKTKDGFVQYTTKWIKSFPTSQTQQNTLRNLSEMLADISEKYSDYHKYFNDFIQERVTQSKTWKFWAQFVFQDCFAYISLYLAMRSGIWSMRVASIKSMAALFSAFDRARYQRLISQHLLDLLHFPPEVLSHVMKGGFTVSIKGRACHSIGIDEAHEMCINRECKEYVTRPSAENMTHTAIYLPIRAKAMKNAEAQLFPEQNEMCSTPITTIHALDRESVKLEMNVKCQVQHLQHSSLAATTPELCHLFKPKKITPEQENDLLNFRGIGQKDFECRVQYDILRNPSVKPPKRQKRLLTFTERKSRRKKVSDIEKERKLQIQCWKKRLEFTSKTGCQLPTFQQCIELPRAIATTDGQPVKGTKSNTTKVYEKRYENACVPVIRTTLPPGWKADTVVMEGMFLINITPWSAHRNMGEYANFLLRQHILIHYRNGAIEVHLLFDDPECQAQSPKYFERLRRDQNNPIPEDHWCSSFTSDMVIPSKWRENILSCRKCKRNLVCFLSLYFTENIKRKLRPQHKFVTAGGLEGPLRNKALSVTFNGTPQSDPQITCNAEESDTRIWLHTIHSCGLNKLILSPDTDVYHIGLPIVAGTNLNVIVQLSAFSSIELRLLDMQALITAFRNDPDLAGISPPLIPKVLQALFVSTGCDFISYFNGLGKATFLNTLYEYCSFICSDSDQLPGLLSNTDEGFHSFARLVGCAYFKKHKSAFLPTYPTPMSLFNSVSNDNLLSITKQHSAWLEFLRERIWSKIQYEEEMLPSDEALKRHWNRACWVLNVWEQCTQNNIIYPPLVGNGWNLSNSNLTIDWDSEENITNIRQTVALIRKGCGCKTGCKSSRCKCKRAGNNCYGCKCIGCCNLPNPTPAQVTDSALSAPSDSGSEESESESYRQVEEDVEATMLEVFGDYGVHCVSDNDSLSSADMNNECMV